MLEHKAALEKHLAARWRDLFGASFEVLLYDLTSTYFEGEAEEVQKAQRGYSRDHRPDCKQLILALVVTPEGFPPRRRRPGQAEAGSWASFPTKSLMAIGPM